MILCQKLRSFTLFCAVLMVMGCKPIVELSTASEPRAAEGAAFSKILVVEEADEATANFYNNLRKDLRFQFAQRGVAAEFVRTVPSLQEPGKRIAEANARFAPDGVLRLTHSQAISYDRWGPLHHEVNEIWLEIALAPGLDALPVWKSTAHVDNFWGADVNTDKVAKMLADALHAARLVR